LREKPKAIYTVVMAL